MKARDLTPACIGRIVRIEAEHTITAVLTSINAARNTSGYLQLTVGLDDHLVTLSGDEPAHLRG